MEPTNPTNGRERSSINGDAGDDKPRVVDKRRFRRLLDEDVPTGELLPEPPRYPSYVEELQSKLQAGEARLLEYAEQMRQARQQMDAELEAIRERLRRNMQEQVEQSKSQFVGPMLDVLDNLKRAIEAAEATRNFDALLDGLKVTAAMFERHLQAFGVVLIGSPGEPFDPRFHEAVESVAVEPERDGQIVEVIQPGYRLGDAVLIRPARVRVGQCSHTE
ncbi:MAG: nucleotide exchange factor GrpE [Acidobacteriota bacterium]|nr:nucleotide exchange factor GrpE [Blastocatellia bacterium]MDW8239866.1 nucleotide exchange factor GrpE [Acidobacteriota bacterium]